MIKISSVEPAICRFEMIYNENIKIEKMAFIARSRKSLTMYRHIEASVMKFCFLKNKVIYISKFKSRHLELSVHVTHSLDGTIRRQYILNSIFLFIFILALASVRAPVR